MEELVLYIVKGLVSKPEEVKIETQSENEAVNLNLIVAPEDMGIVIGKGGQTIRAIRRLISARAMIEKNNRRVYINLVEVK